MQGQYLDVGGRQTYFPPFVHERFGKTPYWACTWASLLNGVNVAYLGRQEASSAEILRLANASGDDDLSSGSRSRHMVTAMRRVYGQTVTIQALPPEKAIERLKTGWALVAGISYARLPEVNKVWSKTFDKGHRVVVLGWSSGRTRLLDPMVGKDRSYAGQWLDWTGFLRAWWSDEQLWFKEGMYLPGPAVRIVSTFKPPRRWEVAAGSLVSAYAPDEPGKVVRTGRIGHDSGAHFDQVVEVTPRESGARPRTFVRVVDGWFEGLLIDPRGEGIRADLDPNSTGTPPSDAVAAVVKQAKREEYARVKAAFDKTKKLPDPPPA